MRDAVHMWQIEEFVDLAEGFVRGIAPRWAHVVAVGQTSEALRQAHPDRVGEAVLAAAWVHDLGYAPELAQTGLHALDGALALRRLGAPVEVVALVGHHTGAAFEAEERGMLEEWQRLPTPDPQALDILTMIDLAASPTGQPVRDVDRVDEILRRYEREHPVHKAVTRSQDELLASSARAKQRLGLPDDWPLVADERMPDSEPHRGVEF